MNASGSSNSKIIFLGLFILMIVLLAVAFSLSNREGILSKNFFGDILEIDFDAYGDNSFDASNLNFRPILDKDVDSSFNNVIYIEFWVGGSKKNNVDSIVYDIALNDLVVDCNLLSSYLKWKLVKNHVEISRGSLDYKFDTIVDGRLVLTNVQQDLVPYNEDKSVYDYYEFYMWLSDSCQDDDLMMCFGSEDQSYLLGKSLSGKIEVELYGNTKQELVRKPSDTIDSTSCMEEDGVSDEVSK